MATDIQESYDWVVLGDHPAALLSASLISKLGFSSIVLPFSPSRLAEITPSSQYFDPEPNFLVGLGHARRTKGLLADCLSFLGVTTSTSNLFQYENSVHPQILTPKLRISVGADDEFLKREVSRELGNEMEARLGLVNALEHSEPISLSFWRDYPEKILKRRDDPKRRHLRYDALDELRKSIASHSSNVKGAAKPWFALNRKLSKQIKDLGLEYSDIEQLFGGLLYGVAFYSDEDPLLIDLMHLLALSRTGVSFKGGMTAYRKFLLSLAKYFGAHVPQETDCTRIFVEEGRLIGVQVANQGKMIGVQGAILGCSVEHIAESLCVSGKNNSLSLKPAPKPDGWRFSMALTVHAEVIPPGMNRRAIWKEKNAPVLEIEVRDPEDYNMGKTDQKFVFIRTVLPYDQKSLDTNLQRVIAARMFRQVCDIFPFLEYHVIRIFPDFRNEIVGDADEFSHAYGFVSPEFIPENLRQIGKGGIGFSTGIQGLYAATGESYPKLGIFGGTVAAVEAVTDFGHRSGMYKGLSDTVRSKNLSKGQGFLKRDSTLGAT